MIFFKSKARRKKTIRDYLGHLIFNLVQLVWIFHSTNWLMPLEMSLVLSLSSFSPRRKIDYTKERILNPSKLQVEHDDEYRLN